MTAIVASGCLSASCLFSVWLYILVEIVMLCCAYPGCTVSPLCSMGVKPAHAQNGEWATYYELETADCHEQANFFFGPTSNFDSKFQQFSICMCTKATVESNFVIDHVLSFSDVMTQCKFILLLSPWNKVAFCFLASWRVYSMKRLQVKICS